MRGRVSYWVFSLVLMLVPLSPLYAQAQAQARASHNSPVIRSASVASLPAVPMDKGIRTSLISILQCARAIANRNRGGADGIRVAAGFLDRARENRASLENLVATKAACERSQTTLAKSSGPRSEQVEAAKMLSASYSLASRQLMKDFVSPTVNCHGINGNLNIGVIISNHLNAGINFLCSGSDGRRWSAVRLGKGRGFGLGLSGNVTTLTTRSTTYQRGPFEKATTSAISAGLLLNGYGDSLTDSSSTSFRGLGVGVGLTYNRVSELSLTVIPLGTTWDTLVTRLLSGDGRAP